MQLAKGNNSLAWVSSRWNFPEFECGDRGNLVRGNIMHQEWWILVVQRSLLILLVTLVLIVHFSEAFGEQSPGKDKLQQLKDNFRKEMKKSKQKLTSKSSVDFRSPPWIMRLRSLFPLLSTEKGVDLLLGRAQKRTTNSRWWQLGAEALFGLFIGSSWALIMHKLNQRRRNGGHDTIEQGLDQILHQEQARLTQDLVRGKDKSSWSRSSAAGMESNLVFGFNAIHWAWCLVAIACLIVASQWLANNDKRKRRRARGP